MHYDYAMSDSLALFSMLLAAARADFRPEHAAILQERWAVFSEWAGLTDALEKHGLGPLFYTHLAEIGAALPEEQDILLKGLVIRHRRATAARRACIKQIMDISSAHGICAVLIKGAAVSYLAYPRADLRPMRDVDLLCEPGDATRLHELLRKAGYRVSEEVPWDHHHLASLVRQVDGFQVHIEIHHHLFHFSWRGRSSTTAELLHRARPFEIDGLPTWSLALEDQLWHTYQHMLSGPIRLMAVADLISLSEKFCDEIDWALLSDRYPQLLNALALFHAQSPLSAEVVAAADIERRNGHIPIGLDLQGWSHIPSSQIRVIGLSKFLYLTFTPSDWWLYLYFGADQHRSIFWYRWLLYPADRLRLFWQRVARQFSSRS